ncbi:hypothetical protein WDU94_013874 [Cyamophila willieti]
MSLGNVNEALEQLYRTLYKAINKHVKIYKNRKPGNIKKKKFPVWWKQETYKLYKRKERIRKIKQKSNKQAQEYNHLRKQCKKLIREDFKTYIQNITDDIKKGKSKSFWNYTKHNKKGNANRTLKYKSQTMSDPQQITTSFAEHFLRAYNPQTSTYTTDENLYQAAGETFCIEHISVGDVEKEISCLRPNKPPGPDGIPPFILKECVEFLKIPLSIIFNHCLTSSMVPSKFKESIVIPVPKKGSDQDIENHRPISNLNAISKVFESIIYTKIESHIGSKISPSQHGFIQRRSTMGNLIEFSDYVARSISQGGEVHCLYTDVEKCFDRIYHDAILNALARNGISVSLVGMFSNYLQNRKMYVRYLNITSSPITPPSGVVQGSRLSSLLFILTYNDLINHVQHSQVLLYADDLKIFKVIHDTRDCELLQEDINSVSEWLKEIGLNFHPKKCYAINFTNKSQPYKPTYYIYNNPIQYCNQYKDLGITFESNLNSKSHILEIKKKAYRQLGMVIRHSKYIQDPDAIKLLYISYVRSVLEYGSIVWNPSTKVDSKELEKIQAKFTRYLFQKLNGFYPNHIGYDLLIEQLLLQSLQTRRLNEQVKLLQNTSTGKLSSPYIREQILQYENIPNPRLRPTRIREQPFKLPNRRETYMFKSPIVKSLDYFNNMEERPNLILQ